MNGDRTVSWPIGWFILALPALFGGGVLALTASYGDAVNTYPVPWSAAGLLAYLATPIVAVASFWLFMLPGLALCRAHAGGDVFRWIVQGFATSLVLTALLSQAATAAGLRLTGLPFATILLALSVVAAVSVPRSAKKRTGVGRRGGRDDSAGPDDPVGDPIDDPIDDPVDDPAWWPFVATSALTLVALAILLAPKLHWEHFNGDGAHAFESARALLSRVTPFWPSEAGDIAAFPGITSFLFALPGVVFLRLLGPLEAAARLPALLYLVPLAAGILGIVRRSGARVATYQIRATWLGLALFIVVLGFSATYNAYTADLALPATQDTLLMATFLGFALAFLDGSPGWMILFGLLSYAGLPSGPLLIVLWGGAAAAFLRPIPWRALMWTGVALGLAALAATIGPALLHALGAPVPGDEYAGASLVERLRDPVLFEIERVFYWVVPCGIVPALMFLAVRGHSAVGKVAIAVTLAYFGLFYLQPKTSLHYYVPAMILPWIVFWTHARQAAVGKAGRPSRHSRALLAAGLVMAFALSVPWGYRLDRMAWTVGATISERVGGYDRSDPRVFAASDLLAEVVPLDWDATVPHESFGGSPLVWLRYADRESPGTGAALHLLPGEGTPPPGARRIAGDSVAALYVTDEAAWRALRGLRPPAPAGAPLYRIPKSTLF